MDIEAYNSNCDLKWMMSGAAVMHTSSLYLLQIQADVALPKIANFPCGSKRQVMLMSFKGAVSPRDHQGLLEPDTIVCVPRQSQISLTMNLITDLT